MKTKDVYPEAIPATPSRLIAANVFPAVTFQKRLSTSLFKHDETAASETLREAQAGYDLITILNEIIIPTLVEIGEAWYTGHIRIATEHFASALVRGKLLSLFQSYPTRKNTRKILVGCAPTEQHELGSLMVAVLLRSQGFNVEYLGPDIPVDDLVDYASEEHPLLIVLSAVTPPAALELKRMQDKLKKLRQPPLFAYGGRAFDLNRKLIEQVPGIYLGNTLELAVKKIRELMPQTSRHSVPA
jgi:methanogenic corrinoid protein MtbC1